MSKAMQHGLESAGAKYLKPGFGWTPEQDLAWALGWPKVVTLVDGDAADSAPESSVFAYLKDPMATGWLADGEFPREVAHRLLRVIATKSPAISGSDPKSGGWIYEPTAANRKAAAKGGEPSESELRTIVDALLAGAQYWSSTLVDFWPLLVEAIAGADVTLALMLDNLEGRTPATLAQAQFEGWFRKPATLVGYQLLRVHRSKHAALHGRWAKLHAKLAKAWAADDAYDARRVLEPLDLALGGAAAVSRSGHRTDGRLAEASVQFCYDDVAIVNEAACAAFPKGWMPSPIPRSAFLGTTEKVLAAFATRWPRLKYASELNEFLTQIARIQSPAAIELLRQAAMKSKSKTLAKALLAQVTGAGGVAMPKPKQVAKRAKK